MKCLNGYELINLLVDALGIRHTHLPIQKIVIECEVEGVPRLYIKGILDEDRVREVVRVFQLVAVDEVHVTEASTVIPANPKVIK
jgi:hypothetical protein